jgi:hypothetical protein
LKCAPIANAATGPSRSTATPASAATSARSAPPARRRWAAAAPTAAANCFSGPVGPRPAHPPSDLALVRVAGPEQDPGPRHFLTARPRPGPAAARGPCFRRRCWAVSASRAVWPGVPAIYDGAMNDTETSLRAENAELRRLLDKHQWAGLTPVKSAGCCPECCGASPPRGRGHRPGCAIAAILVVTAPPPDGL